MMKAVFFDMDGTLLSHSQKKIPESAIAALWKLKEQGIKIVITTGRHMSELEELSLLDFPYDGFITVNGSICLDENRELFYIQPIEGQDKELLLQMFDEKQIPIMLVEKDHMYINFINDDVRKTQKDISTEVPPIAEYRDNDVVMACVYVRSDVEAVLKSFQNLRITRWNRRAVDVIPANSGKSKGIELFMEKYHILQSETMAFGDEENDIDMLKFCAISVAMGNANDKVKSVADYVTDDVDCDGIEKGLRYFHLI